MSFDPGVDAPPDGPPILETPPLAWLLRAGWETAVLRGACESWGEWLHAELGDTTLGIAAAEPPTLSQLDDLNSVNTPSVAGPVPAMIRLVPGDADAHLPDAVVELLATLNRELRHIKAPSRYYDALVRDGVVGAVRESRPVGRATAGVPAWAVAPLASRAAAAQHQWLPRVVESAERFAAPPAIVDAAPSEVPLETVVTAIVGIALARTRLGWPSDPAADALLLGTQREPRAKSKGSSA